MGSYQPRVARCRLNRNRNWSTLRSMSRLRLTSWRTSLVTRAKWCAVLSGPVVVRRCVVRNVMTTTYEAVLELLDEWGLREEWRTQAACAKAVAAGTATPDLWFP